MNMSEFEEQLNKDNFSSPPTKARELPADFSEEDRAFVQELDTLFALHKEELPPYYVQTLLEPDDQRFRVVEHGFEQKTSARVFRRLKLRRRLFHSYRISLHAVINALPMRRTLLAFGTALMLFMMLTAFFTGPSFADGLALLLSGSHSGVLQVRTYPNGVRPEPLFNVNQSPALQTLNLLEAQQELHFPMYWPHSIPNDYTLSNIYLFQQPERSWADGPTMELDYDISASGVITHGTGQIAIREFKPKAGIDVLQVVQNGAAYPLQIDQNGQAQAIYVDGQWVSHNMFSHVWVFGQRSELIYQRDGIVFWIVGDQRDGIKKDALLKIADSLQVFNMSRLIHAGFYMNSVTQLFEDVTGLFAGDIIAFFPDDGTDGLSLSLIGSGRSMPERPPKTVSHSH